MPTVSLAVLAVAVVLNIVPPHMAYLLVFAVILSSAAPKILRALDERRIVRAAAKQITTEDGAVRALQAMRSTQQIVDEPADGQSEAS